MKTTPARVIRLGAILMALWGLGAPLPTWAGQLVWTPGGEAPTLILSLGDGLVKKTLDLPTGASSLNLTLRAFLLEDTRLQLTWRQDTELWLRQSKKIPGAETTERVALPPGRNITLEITTVSGTPVASIKLRRN